jgi:uncharacterized membrane protein
MQEEREMAYLERTWRGPTPVLRQRRNVGEAERWASAAAAAALAAWAVRQDRRNGWWAAAAGALLAFRAGTGHCPMYAAAGIDTSHGAGTRRALAGSGGIHVHEEVTIDRPVADVYAFWRNFENLPRVMRHLASVTGQGRRTHWVAKAPAGLTAEWDAEIIHEEPDRLIGWRSVDGSTVATAGSVHFEPLPGGRSTRVWVRFQYDPPGGRLGAWFAGLAGADPALEVREDLQALKSWMETDRSDA